MTGLHACKCVSIQRETLRVNISGTQSGSRRQHQHAGFFGSTHLGRLGHAAIVAIVSGHKRYGSAGFLFECGRVVGKEIPPGETRWEIRRAIEDAISLIGARQSEADRLDLSP